MYAISDFVDFAFDTISKAAVFTIAAAIPIWALILTIKGIHILFGV